MRYLIGRWLWVCILAFAIGAPAMATSPEDSLGFWRTPDGGAVMELYPQDGNSYGIRFAWVTEEAPTELRQKVGDDFVSGLSWEGRRASFSGGSIEFEWEGKKTAVACSATPRGNVELEFKISLGLFSKSFRWVRCDEPKG